MGGHAIDLSFCVTGQAIAADHGYLLYSAIARALPAVHEPNGIGIHPIRGQIVGDRQMQLCEWSRLVIRTDADRIAALLPLAGKSLRVGPAMLRVGVPEVRSLIPAPTLRSRLVTIRNGTEPDRFQKEVRRKLDALGISQEAFTILPPRHGRPIRRTIRIKDKEVVGYEVIVEGLTAEESLALQENRASDAALRFSRTHMGCGIFSPLLPKGESL